MDARDALKRITLTIQSLLRSSGFARSIIMTFMVKSPPDRPTLARLKKLIALADDARGDVMMRRAAKRKLAMYARFYPTLVRVKDDQRKDR